MILFENVTYQKKKKKKIILECCLMLLKELDPLRK